MAEAASRDAAGVTQRGAGTGPRPLLPVAVSELCPSLAGRTGLVLIEPEGLGEEGAKLGFVRALINHVEQRRSQGRSGLPDKGLSSSVAMYLQPSWGSLPVFSGRFPQPVPSEPFPLAEHKRSRASPASLQQHRLCLKTAAEPPAGSVTPGPCAWCFPVPCWCRAPSSPRRIPSPRGARGWRQGCSCPPRGRAGCCRAVVQDDPASLWEAAAGRSPVPTNPAEG